MFPGGKDGRCVRLTTLPPSCADCLKILGASTSWNPQGLSRPVMGLVFFNTGIWHFKKCLQGRRKNQNHWRKQHISLTYMGAATPTLSTTLSNESMSWHGPIYRTNNYTLPHKSSRTDLTMQIQKTDGTLPRIEPKEHSLLTQYKIHIRCNKIMWVAVRKSEIFYFLLQHLTLSLLMSHICGVCEKFGEWDERRQSKNVW
jgi:hypothetical protein